MMKMQTELMTMASNQESSLSFSSLLGSNQRWVIIFKGMVGKIPKIGLAEIRANLTRGLGWFNEEYKKAWK